MFWILVQCGLDINSSVCLFRKVEGASGNLRKEESDSSVQDPETEGGSAQRWATCSGGYSVCSLGHTGLHVVGGCSVCSLGHRAPAVLSQERGYTCCAFIVSQLCCEGCGCDKHVVRDVGVTGM